MLSSQYFHPTVMALGALVFVMCFGSFVQFLFLRGLRKHHQEQWKHAGQPTIWTDQSLFSAWPTISYLQRRAFCSSNDSAGIVFCQRFRIALLLSYWGTVLLLVLFFVLLFTAGWPKDLLQEAPKQQALFGAGLKADRPDMAQFKFSSPTVSGIGLS